MSRWSAEEELDLRYAKRLLEHPSLGARVAHLIGMPMEKAIEMLPAPAGAVIARASRASLERALRVAVLTLADEPRIDASETAHTVAAAASGLTGGAFGLAALPVELPFSTLIMLRSIADIARSEGEPVRAPETKVACLEVFALGGRSHADDAAESTYFAVRLALAQAVREAAAHLAVRGLSQDAAPALVQLIARIAARFEIAVSQKVAAQALPLIGALGGALVNTLFIDHYQNVARGHFIVRRLERSHGPELIQEKYRTV